MIAIIPGTTRYVIDPARTRRLDTKKLEIARKTPIVRRTNSEVNVAIEILFPSLLILLARYKFNIDSPKKISNVSLEAVSGEEKMMSVAMTPKTMKL